MKHGDTAAGVAGRAVPAGLHALSRGRARDHHLDGVAADRRSRPRDGHAAHRAGRAPGPADTGGPPAGRARRDNPCRSRGRAARPGIAGRAQRHAAGRWIQHRVPRLPAAGHRHPGGYASPGARAAPRARARRGHGVAGHRPGRPRARLRLQPCSRRCQPRHAHRVVHSGAVCSAGSAAAGARL